MQGDLLEDSHRVRTVPYNFFSFRSLRVFLHAAYFAQFFSIHARAWSLREKKIIFRVETGPARSYLVSGWLVTSRRLGGDVHVHVPFFFSSTF